MPGRKQSIMGSTIGGRFQVIKLLGSGGIGEVYMAEHRELCSPFAVKVLKRDLAGNPEVVARFRREAIAAGRIQHRNIVYLTDFGQLDDGRLYLVMEYLEGTSLQELLDAHGAMEVGRTLKIFLQVADGLRYAHENGVIHRDLKPDNIMLVTTPGDNNHVKLIDFGLAKLLGESSSKLTADGAVFGTPHNMSPEQTQGLPIDHRTDIYSFGTVLYECLTGKPPFDVNNIYMLLEAHKNKRVEPPSARTDNEEIFPELEAVVMQCLEKKPQKRYQSFDAVLSDLRLCEKIYAKNFSRVGILDLGGPEDDWTESHTFSRLSGLEPGTPVFRKPDSMLPEPFTDSLHSEEERRKTVQRFVETRGTDGVEGIQAGSALESPPARSKRKPQRDSVLVPGKAWRGRSKDMSIWEADTIWGDHAGGSTDDFESQPTRMDAGPEDESTPLSAETSSQAPLKYAMGKIGFSPREPSEWWHDEYTLRMLQDIGNQLREMRLAPPELIHVLIGIFDEEERLLASGTQKSLEEDRFREMEDSYRERLGRLRRAVIELNLEKAFIMDQYADDPGLEKNIDEISSRVQALERRQHELQIEEKKQLAAWKNELAVLNKEVEALQGNLVILYHRLWELVENARCNVQNADLLSQYAILDKFLRNKN